MTLEERTGTLVKDITEVSVCPASKSAVRDIVTPFIRKEIIKELEGILDTASGGGAWRRIITQRIDQIKEENLDWSKAEIVEFPNLKATKLK